MRRDQPGGGEQSERTEPDRGPSGVLEGRRCLLLRAEQQSGPTADLLRVRGAVPVVLPLLEILPPPDPARLIEAARSLSSYDLVAFTSENAVERFFAALDEVHRSAGSLTWPRVAAIGRGTARALERRAVSADVVPTHFVGEAFAEAILADLASRGGARGKRVLLPRALVAREVLPEELVTHGVVVDVVPAYETRRASAAAQARLRELVERGEVDVVLLSSSSMAEAFVEALGGGLFALPWQVVLASIGEITTKAAERLGLPIDVTAEDSTMPGLIAAVEALLERRLAEQD